MWELNNSPLFQELKQIVQTQDYKCIKRCSVPDEIMSASNFLAGRKSIFEFVEQLASIDTTAEDFDNGDKQ